MVGGAAVHEQDGSGRRDEKREQITAPMRPRVVMRWCDLLVTRGYAQSSSSISTPFKASVIGGLSRSAFQVKHRRTVQQKTTKRKIECRYIHRERDG